MSQIKSKLDHSENNTLLKIKRIKNNNNNNVLAVMWSCWTHTRNCSVFSDDESREIHHINEYQIMNNYTDNDLSHLSINFNINNNRQFTVLIKYIYYTLPAWVNINQQQQDCIERNKN